MLIYQIKSLFNHRRFITFGFLIQTIIETFKVRVLRMARVRNVQMAITFRCNHSCIFCSSNKLLKKDRPEMGIMDWFKIVDQLKALGCTHFDITGGEPSMWYRTTLRDLIRYIQDGKRVVSVATNGKLVDEAWLKMMKDAGLTAIELDLQSVDRSWHDLLVRDTGNYNKIMSLIKAAKRIRLNVCINTCLSDESWEETARLMDWCEQNKIHCLLNLGAPTGKYTDQKVRITDRKKEYYKLLYSHAYSRSDTSYNFRGFNLCPGGIEKLYITSYGEVMQCTFCQISYGNVLKEPLSIIHRRFVANPDIRRRGICKHTFSKEFREKWIEPVQEQKPPMPLTIHPAYNNCNIDPYTYKKSLGFLFNYLLGQKLKELRMWLSKTDTTFDIGAGFGQYAHELSRLGYNITPVEPDERYTRGYSLAYYNCKGEDVRYTGDAAYMINVLHHADNPVKLLHNLRVNRLIISELNRRNLFVRLYVKLFVRHEDVQTHLSRTEVEELLKASGWKIRLHYTTSLLGIPFTYNWFICTKDGK